MPRGRTNTAISSLSVNIPRRIHRAARVKFIRSGAPSFAAYVAMILDRAPDQPALEDTMAAHLVEIELVSLTHRDRKVGHHDSEPSVSGLSRGLP